MKSGQHPDRQIQIKLPKPEFLYTVDQLAMILSVKKQGVLRNFLWYEGRSVGLRPEDRMRAVNIAGPDDTPDWRVQEKEVKRWMRKKGFSYYDR